MTSRKLMLVDPDRAEEVVSGAKRLSAILRQLEANIAEAHALLDQFLANGGAGIGFLALGGEGAPLQIRLRMTGPRRYRIGPGGWSYSDVVNAEVHQREFSLDEAWDRIRGLIETDSDRARDGLRQALDRDEQFERIDRRGGIWYRRLFANGGGAMNLSEKEAVAT